MTFASDSKSETKLVLICTTSLGPVEQLVNNKPKKIIIPIAFFMIPKSYTLINVESVQVLRLISLENLKYIF